MCPDHYQKFQALRIDASLFVGLYLDSKRELKVCKLDASGKVVQRSGALVRYSVSDYKAVRFGSNILVYIERLVHKYDPALHETSLSAMYVIDADDLIVLNQVLSYF
jgi:hypothetical protein